MRCFVTGAAGFIGSHLVDALLVAGHEVIGFDSLSTGKKTNLPDHERFRFVLGNIHDFWSLRKAISGCDMVFHLAAHADVRSGVDNPYVDLRENTQGTFRVLDAIRQTGVKRIAFTSTASVYGNSFIGPATEHGIFPVQNSLYGASKLAAEGLIQAFCEAYKMQSYIFRLVSVLGERYSHGHVVDFYKQLVEHPDYLHVLGDGTARKAYIYVQDVVDAILLVVGQVSRPVNIFNVSPNWTISVAEAARTICEQMAVRTEIHFGSHERGWIGDSVYTQLNADKLRYLGWKPTLTYLKMVRKTLDYLEAHREVARA